MRLLLDTHVLLWWLEDSPKLPRAADEVMQSLDAEIFVSAASAWEISTKARIGKLAGYRHLADDLPEVLRRQAFTPLDISFLHARRAGSLSGTHRDPFDRMLAAQALEENLVLISSDRVLDEFGVNRLWW